jgi:hypothetical protein
MHNAYKGRAQCKHTVTQAGQKFDPKLLSNSLARNLPVATSMVSQNCGAFDWSSWRLCEISGAKKIRAGQ